MNLKIAKKSMKLDDENLQESPKVKFLDRSDSREIINQLKKIDQEVKKQLEKYV